MKSNIIKYIFFVIIAVLLIFAVYKVNNNDDQKNGTASNSNAAQLQEITKEIRVAVAGLDNINPILSKNKNVQDVSKLIYEPLVNITQDFKAEPCLAVEWAKTDGNSYIIKLREDVNWANGEKFTSQDVRFTIDKLKEVESIYSYNVQYVTGVDEVDEHTIKIKLDREIPFFEYNLTFPIMSKTYYDGENFSNTEKNKAPVGTGIFKISKTTDSNIILEKNDNWWNNSNKNSKLEKITINTNSSMAEVYNSFKMGNIDFLNTSNLSYTDYIGTLGYSKKEYVGREHGFIVLNTKSGLLVNTEVRKAILSGIDKNNIVGNVFGGKYYTSDFPLSYGSWLDNKEDGNSTYNPENTYKILEEAGWTLRRGNWQRTANRRTEKLVVNLLVKASDNTRVNIANVIQNQLAQEGIGVNIQAVGDSHFNNNLNSKNYDMVLMVSDVSTSPNLTTYFGEDNMANYSNKEVADIMKEVSNSTDENTLKEKYKRLKEIYKSDVPYISLYFSKNVAIYNTGLAGEVTPNWYNLFYNIENWYK
ncbi:MAG: hypothetical protein IKF17_02025 [Clostridia bacterium]|nr:hypothetical protein [Clostridia bacterium]